LSAPSPASARLLAAITTAAGATRSAAVVVNEVYGGRRQLGRYVHQRLHRARQPRHRPDQPLRLVGPVPLVGAAGAWHVTPLAGSIAPGAFCLIGEAQGAGGTQPLPPTQASGTIAMSGTAGTVALVNTATALTCADSTSCLAASIDLVGYGRPRSARARRSRARRTRTRYSAPTPVGDVFTGATVGPVDYSNLAGYVITATTLGARQDNGLVPLLTTPQSSKQLAVATYNVENLAPSDPAARYQRLAEGVVNNLARPDAIAVEEVQDNSGATDDGVVASDVTLTKLTDAIVAAWWPAVSVSLDRPGQ
jgi:hypothetical protein